MIIVNWAGLGGGLCTVEEKFPFLSDEKNKQSHFHDTSTGKQQQIVEQSRAGLTR